MDCKRISQHAGIPDCAITSKITTRYWPDTRQSWTKLRLEVCVPLDPDGDVVEGQQEASKEEEDQEQEAATRHTHVLIPAQGCNEAEQAQTMAVKKEQEQQVGEEPVAGQHGC